MTEITQCWLVLTPGQSVKIVKQVGPNQSLISGPYSITFQPNGQWRSSSEAQDAKKEFENAMSTPISNVTQLYPDKIVPQPKIRRMRAIFTKDAK